MPRYIDADVVIAKCKAIINDKWNEQAAPASWADAYADFVDDIENVPTSDVEPVRHGRWEHNQDVILYLVCSECAYYVQHEYKFCPNCGAKMSEGESDE